ncbi:MAG TPA: hypothetical protein VJQ52_22420 [Steroidobacteraceae bacterium]|nr:hypothetical protein [Steroidobacteraceae bacterium]
MQRHYRVLSIGLVGVLAGLSVVLAFNRERASQRTEQRGSQLPTQAAAGPPAAAEHHAQAAPSVVQVLQREATPGGKPLTLDDLERLQKSTPKAALSAEHVAAHRAQERMMARREYGMLFELLQLSPQQEEEFLEVVVADMMADPGIAELRANRAKWERERNDKLNAIVGFEKAPLFEGYLRNIEEYTRVANVGMQLDAAGAPLSKEQKHYLVALLVAERERVPQPSSQKPIATQADVERELDWMADQDRRIREGAAGVLSSRQLRYLDEIQDARLAKRRVALNMLPGIGAR